MHAAFDDANSERVVLELQRYFQSLFPMSMQRIRQGYDRDTCVVFFTFVFVYSTIFLSFDKCTAYCHPTSRSKSISSHITWVGWSEKSIVQTRLDIFMSTHSNSQIIKNASSLHWMLEAGIQEAQEEENLNGISPCTSKREHETIPPLLPLCLILQKRKFSHARQIPFRWNGRSIP